LNIRLAGKRIVKQTEYASISDDKRSKNRPAVRKEQADFLKLNFALKTAALTA
jgi:hypothetical protein